MDLATLIAKNSFLIALLIIVIFLLVQFYLKPKYFNKPQPSPASPAAAQEKTQVALVPNQAAIPEVQSEVKTDKKQKFLQNLKDNYNKFANSEFVQNMQQEQQEAKWDDMLPIEFKGGESSDDNPFATKL